MSPSTLILSALVTIAVPPAYAQCGGGHSGHGGHSATQDHTGHEEGGPTIKATNTICPVMGQPVKRGRDREVVIRGNYYLVCCDGCGPEMSEHYDKYLDKDGTPLNDPRRDPGAASELGADKPAHEGHPH